MAKLSIIAGTTSKLLRIFVPNSSVTTGAGLTGLAFGTAGLTGYYIREGANATTQITLATQTLGTWATGGFIVVDGTNMPGMYEISIPNAALAAGAKSVVIYYQGASNMAPVVLEVELTAIDNQSTAFGLSIAKTTNITGFNDIAASAVVSSGAITTSGGAVSTVTTTTTATNLTNAPTAGDFTATMKTSLNSATPTSVTTVTGNVNGSVNSVTSAVTVSGTSALTESYAAQGAGLTLAQALYGINQFLGQHSTATTTWTVKKRDGSTTAKTYTLDSATTPTSITETT